MLRLAPYYITFNKIVWRENFIIPYKSIENFNFKWTYTFSEGRSKFVSLDIIIKKIVESSNQEISISFKNEGIWSQNLAMKRLRNSFKS